MANNNSIDEFRNQIQNWIDQMQKAGHQLNLDDINNHVAKVAQSHNYAPRAQFNGFSPRQMTQMLHFPLESGCPVQLRTLTEEEIRKIPIMRQALHLMEALEQNDIKLTPKGSLPIKMVEALYQMGTHSWDTDWFKQKTEDRSKEVQTVRIALEQTGLVKKRLGKMSLTAKGRKMLSNHNEILRTILLFLLSRFNTGYFDAVEDMDTGNIGRLYSLWLLHRYGDQWRDMSFYEAEYFKAFPSLEEDSVYEVRVFERLFRYIGLCEINDDEEYRGRNWNSETRKTPILDMMFSFEEPARI